MRIDLRNDPHDDAPLFRVYDLKTGIRIDYVFLVDDTKGVVGRYERRGGEFVKDPATGRVRQVVEFRAVLVELLAGGKPRREVFDESKRDFLRRTKLGGGLGKVKSGV